MAIRKMRAGDVVWVDVHGKPVEAMWFPPVDGKRSDFVWPNVEGEKVKTTTKPGDRLMAALDAASYEWMEQQYPLILAALEKDMAAGLSVQDAKRLAYERTGADRQIALRIEQAARHIINHD